MNIEYSVVYKLSGSREVNGKRKCHIIYVSKEKRGTLFLIK